LLNNINDDVNFILLDCLPYSFLSDLSCMGWNINYLYLAGLGGWAELIKRCKHFCINYSNCYKPSCVLPYEGVISR